VPVYWACVLYLLCACMLLMPSIAIMCLRAVLNSAMCAYISCLIMPSCIYMLVLCLGHIAGVSRPARGRVSKAHSGDGGAGSEEHAERNPGAYCLLPNSALWGA